MKDSEHRKILFISPAFFGYEKEIRTELLKRGDEVDFFDERPKNTTITKALIRVNPKLISKITRQYYRKVFSATRLKKYDFVFIINIESMDVNLLKELKSQQRDAVFILYMWDSIKNKKNVTDVIPLFDRVFSFDENDALKIESVLFHPLFFIEKYLSKSSSNYDSCKIDLSFIGTIHSDRYKLIKEIFSRYLDLKLKTYYYLYLSTRLLYAYHKLFNPAFESSKYREFRFKALSQEEIIEIFENSKVILDIQHPLQTGLTMRTFETMALGRKLITTNATINRYDFYNNQNILIIDRNNVEIPASFLEMPFKKIHDEILNKYSLRNWLKIIFDD